MISTESLKKQVRRVVPHGWAPHPNLWVVACDYATGRRVAFGRDGSPPAELADAVAASCTIPGFYGPVEIGGRRYVDGGVHSASNLDLLRDEQLDLVICLNPTSTLHPIRALNPREWPTLLFRRESGHRLGGEAKKLRGAGTPVVLVQPTRRDLDAMSVNLMSRSNRNEVIATASETVAQQLRSPEIRDLLAGLPGGRPEKVRRPSEPPSEWGELLGLPGSESRIGPQPSRQAAAG
jgi:NTE family protein